MVSDLEPLDIAPYRTSIAMKTLQAFGDIWLTDKPKCWRSSCFSVFKGDTSSRHLPGRSNGSSNHGWNQGFHK